LKTRITELFDIEHPGLIRDVPTCKELVDRIMAEAESLITRRLAGLVGAAA